VVSLSNHDRHTFDGLRVTGFNGGVLPLLMQGSIARAVYPPASPQATPIGSVCRGSVGEELVAVLRRAGRRPASLMRRSISARATMKIAPSAVTTFSSMTCCHVVDAVLEGDLADLGALGQP